ncbi:hypothetical protein [uncultured Desulfovibrio sp.]|uniref:hypothetical protein n=1 Tax=uncultured Desulfovibrio sp. TaxID=167968 RepID=UPI00280646ED|nr:hypothetical protein [uncultured Desulfovibrio sp.]
MTIRIQQYSTPPRRIQAGGVDAGFARPLIRDAGRSADTDLINDMLRAGRQITEVGIREYVRDQSTAVAAALNDYRRQLSEELERYTTENKGQDAVNAGAHFDAFAREAAAPLAERFSGRFREMFQRDAAATGLHFMEQGQAYGRQEKAAWEKSVFEGDMSQTLDAIANDPGNAEFVQQSLAELKQRMVAMTPGLDHRAMEADLNRKVAGVTIDALLAKDNVGGASGALSQYRELLGAAAPQYEARIRAKGRELESRARSQQVNNFLFATSNMDALERMALAEEQFGKDPARKAQYDAIRSGIMHEEKAREDMERFVAKREMDAMLGEMTEIAKLPPEESFARMKEMEQRLPLEKREAFFKAANNIRNPANRDDPLAIEEITERKLSGEVFNVRAEYGSRITSATCAKLEKQGFDKSLHSIREAFNSSAFEYLADDKNKDAAKELGYSTPSALWTRFLASTDADEKHDAVRLKKEADEFFKRVILNESRTLWADKEIQTISGLAGSYVNAAMADERRIVPAQGSEAYGRVTAALQEAGVEPEGTFGGYSEQQLANGYAALLKGGAK